MPIKPENRARYPKNWREIRARILERADNRCEGSPDFPNCRRPNGWILNKRTGELTNNGEQADTWRLVDCDPCVLIVLTIAHLGLPAHFPVHLHVTRTAKTDEVFDVIGLVMPLDSEAPKWHTMMHHRALSEFQRGPSAVRAPFFIALPSSGPRFRPRGAIMHKPFSMAPEKIIFTDWRLFGKPTEATSIAAEATPPIQIPSTDIERIAATFALPFPESTLATAHGFIATGRRTGLDPIGRLLGANKKIIPADNAAQIRGAFTWSGHTEIYHADEYPENCADDNLRAWCQRCHLHYDRKHHAINSYTTRKAKANTKDLFDRS